MRHSVAKEDPPYWVTEEVGCRCSDCSTNTRVVKLVLENDVELVPCEHNLVEEDGTEHMFETLGRDKEIKCYGFGEYGITALLGKDAINEMVKSGVLEVEER